MRGRGLAFMVGRATARNNSAPSQDSQSSSMDTSQADGLEKLVNMHDRGELSDAEFSQAKKKLLSGN